MIGSIVIKSSTMKLLPSGLLFHEKLEPLGKPKRGKIKRRTGHNLLLRLKNLQRRYVKVFA